MKKNLQRKIASVSKLKKYKYYSLAHKQSQKKSVDDNDHLLPYNDVCVTRERGIKKGIELLLYKHILTIEICKKVAGCRYTVPAALHGNTITNIRYRNTHLRNAISRREIFKSKYLGHFSPLS